MLVARSRVISSTALVVVLGAAAAVGCGSSDHTDGQPAAPRAGNSGDAGEPGVGGAVSGGSSGSAGEAGKPAGGSPNAAGMGGAGNASGRGPSAGAGGTAGMPSTLSPHALAATPHGACALDDGGFIDCWGLESETWDIPQGSFTALYSGRADAGTVCAVRSDGVVTCFAEPFGTPSTDYYPDVPVKTLAIGAGVICGVDTSDRPFCNAANDALMLEPPPGEHFEALSVGNQFGCGIRPSDRSIVCWSADMFGSCDYSPPDNQLESPPGSFADISSGAFSSCAVAIDGSVKCWGLGEAADDPSSDECFASQAVGQADPPSGHFRALVAGKYHTCAIRADGTLGCWGAGETNVCGNDDIDCGQSLPPEGQFEQVSVGLVHSCAMRADRTVTCWGYDGEGRTTPPEQFR